MNTLFRPGWWTRVGWFATQFTVAAALTFGGWAIGYQDLDVPVCCAGFMDQWPEWLFVMAWLVVGWTNLIGYWCWFRRRSHLVLLVVWSYPGVWTMWSATEAIARFWRRLGGCP